MRLDDADPWIVSVGMTGAYVNGIRVSIFLGPENSIFNALFRNDTPGVNSDQIGVGTFAALKFAKLSQTHFGAFFKWCSE